MARCYASPVASWHSIRLTVHHFVRSMQLGCIFVVYLRRWVHPLLGRSGVLSPTVQG